MTSLLDVHGARKAYGGTLALSSGDLQVDEGTIHGIVGPNGAGKSTLMKIIAGHVPIDEGEVLFQGEPIAPASPRDAQKLGIFAVPQEIALAESMSVAENISMGAEPTWGPFVRRRRIRAIGTSALAELGLDFPSSRLAGSLRGDEQRLVMFAQSLSRNAVLMIADEPTAGLSTEEAEKVLAGLERMKAQGRTLLFVSHRFGEVLRLCDRVTVMSDGATRRTFERADLTRADLIRAVAGEEESGARTAGSAQTEGEPSVRAADLHGRELRGVSLHAHKGEVLGVMGLAGSGVDELLGIIGGATQAASGTVTVGEEECRFSTPADAISTGVAYLPADRTQAALLGISVTTNVMLSRTREASPHGLVTRGAERHATAGVLGRLRLEQHARKPLSALSGGNRQRALIARSMFARAEILVFADPTVGVDFRARAEIHELLRALAAEGKTVLISSSEPEEIVMLADRVVVLRSGEVAAALEGDDISLEALTRAATH